MAIRQPPPQLPPGDAPREGCACERADPHRGACFPAEQGLEHPLWFSSHGFLQTRPTRGGGLKQRAHILGLANCHDTPLPRLTVQASSPYTFLLLLPALAV